MIDVIIPAYNCKETLGRTLGSLVAQTDNNFEVIVVDDNSTQDLNPIIMDYSNKLNIKYIRNENNVGCGMSRQVGIDNTSCGFFTFLDSDDMFMPYTVETFNSIIEENPATQFIHSYFYQQIIVDGDPAIKLIKDGYTWCHGKLYNADCIRKYGICNSPLVKYADDSYFNSMCSELLEMSIVRLPLVLWTNNKDSITRREDPVRDKTALLDLLNALYMSSAHIMKYKPHIEHLAITLEKMSPEIYAFTDEEKVLYEKLKEFLQKG